VRLNIDRTWDGEPAEDGVSMQIRVLADSLEMQVDAPYHGDPPPPGPAGATEGLWDYEVVELFVAGPDAAEPAYTEIELSPHGHHLVLQLRGVRKVVASGLPLAFVARIAGDRWMGEASVPRSYLPQGPYRVNAYAIHGVGDRRCLAMTPLPGPRPDFHQPAGFRVPLDIGGPPRSTR
jgi:hypothetical protein